MARSVKGAKLDTRTARVRLPLRREPHWRAISKGTHVGYRKSRRGGTWVARYYQASGGYVYATLGVADDVEDADGTRVLDFRQAQERARAWFAERARLDADPGHRQGYTVRDAMADYLADYGKRGRALQDVKYRVNAFILPELGDVEVARLTARRIREWRDKLAETPARLRTRKGKEQRYRAPTGDPEEVRRRRHTSNKVLAILKAALNFAFAEGRAASDEAWRRVRPFDGVDQPRIRFPKDDREITRLINACEPEFRRLVQAALLTGARYGELATMRVLDFDAAAGSIYVPPAKTSKGRHVILTDEGTKFFKALTAGRGDEFMFTRTVAEKDVDGKERGRVIPWGRAHQQRPMERACSRAKIKPPISFHILRHWYAAHLIRASVPLAIVAENLGHADTRMTTRHYGHLAPHHRAEAIRALAPALGLKIPHGGKVVAA